MVLTPDLVRVCLKIENQIPVSHQVVNSCLTREKKPVGGAKQSYRYCCRDLPLVQDILGKILAICKVEEAAKDLVHYGSKTN